MTGLDEATTGQQARSVPWRRLFGHFAEMVAAMVVGMAVLGAVVRLGLTLLGYADVLNRVEARVVVMVFTMGAGMTVWMRYRRHHWTGIVEMNFAMLMSFMVLLVPYWAGMMPETAVMTIGHILMLPAMALVLIRRNGRDAPASAAYVGSQNVPEPPVSCSYPRFASNRQTLLSDVPAHGVVAPPAGTHPRRSTSNG